VPARCSSFHCIASTVSWAFPPALPNHQDRDGSVLCRHHHHYNHYHRFSLSFLHANRPCPTSPCQDPALVRAVRNLPSRQTDRPHKRNTVHILQFYSLRCGLHHRAVDESTKSRRLSRDNCHMNRKLSLVRTNEEGECGDFNILFVVSLSSR
jgi:hypothetical protein